jgi:hypothetical protein
VTIQEVPRIERTERGKFRAVVSRLSRRNGDGRLDEDRGHAV